MAKKAHNSIENNAKPTAKGKPRGKPFPKGHALGFKAGVSGNPGGAPKGEKFETTLARYLERDAAEVSRLVDISITNREGLKGITFQDALILRTLGAFYNDPNGSFFVTLRETKEGKLTERVETESTVTVNDPREKLAHLINNVATRTRPSGDSGSTNSG